jgi:SOS-response transcriptional repressor LexA
MKASRRDHSLLPPHAHDAAPPEGEEASGLALVSAIAAPEGANESVRAERLATIREQEVLAALAARDEMFRADSPYYTDERLVNWLDRELNASHRASAGWSVERIREAAMRMRAKAEGARLKVRLVGGPPQTERPMVAGMVAQVLGEASAMRSAPQLDLGVAAGAGRDLWDESCEVWVRIPDDAPPGQYVSLSVVGESMDPLLHTGDSVLVRVDPNVIRDTVILARLPEGGYVVKRVGKMTRARLELLSLNPAFPPISVPREANTVLGTVILRWCPHGAVA